jgi:hypothetical protein
VPVDPRMFAPADIVGSYQRGLQARQQQQEAQGRKRLGDLLPQAMGYPGAIGEGGATQQGSQSDAMREIAGIDPKLFMDLNEHQRKQAADEVDEVVGAVRWADTPEKWQQVQQRYGQMGHDVSGYTFENREGYLLQLGKMGEYLKGAPKADNQTSDIQNYEYAKRDGYTGSFVDYKNEFASPLIFDVNGDGANDMIPRGRGRQQPQSEDLPRVSGEADYNQLRPGQRFITPDGQVRVKRGGPTQPASGNFPSSGY